MFTTLILYFIVNDGDAPVESSASQQEMEWWCPICKIGSLMAISYFSMINCNTVIEMTSKSYTKRPLLIVMIVDIATFIIYLSLGIMSILFSRSSNITTSIWELYTGYGNGWGKPTDGEYIWAIIIRIVIMSLPIIVTISIYPPLVQAAAQSVYRFFNIQTFIFYHPNIDRLMRGGISLIPIFLTICYNDSFKILSFDGVFATIMSVTIPALLEFVSSKHVQRLFGEGLHKSIYTVKFISSSFVSKPIFFFSFVIIIFECLYVIFGYL